LLWSEEVSCTGVSDTEGGSETQLAECRIVLFV